MSEISSSSKNEEDMRGQEDAAAFSLSLLMFLTILLWSRALFKGVPDKEFEFL